MSLTMVVMGSLVINLGVPIEIGIVGAVIGGASLMGGRGSVAGAIIGAMTMASIRFGLNVMGMSSFIQQIVGGCILIAAVLLDTLRMNDQLSLAALGLARKQKPD